MGGKFVKMYLKKGSTGFFVKPYINGRRIKGMKQFFMVSSILYLKTIVSEGYEYE